MESVGESLNLTYKDDTGHCQGVIAAPEILLQDRIDNWVTNVKMHNCPFRVIW